MSCWCGASAEGCTLFGYHVGPLAPAADREQAEEERAFLRRLFPDHRTVEQAIADAERLARAAREREAAATAAEVARVAAEQARWTRWCPSCEACVFPVYPRERTCVRCGEAFESELGLAAE